MQGQIVSAREMNPHGVECGGMKIIPPYNTDDTLQGQIASARIPYLTNVRKPAAKTHISPTKSSFASSLSRKEDREEK